MSALRDLGRGGAQKLVEEHPEWEEFVAELTRAAEERLAVHLKDCSKCRCFSVYSQRSGLKKQQLGLTEAALSTLCREGLYDMKRQVATSVQQEKNAMIDEIADSIGIGVIDINEYPPVVEQRFDETFASLAICAAERDRVLSQANMREELAPTLRKFTSVQVALEHWYALMARGVFGPKGVPHCGSSSLTASEVEAAGLQLLRLHFGTTVQMVKAWESRWPPVTFPEVFSIFGFPFFDIAGPPPEPPRRQGAAGAAIAVAEAALQLASWKQVGQQWVVDLEDELLQSEALAEVRPMRVVVRVRPALDHEIGDNLTARALEDGATVAFKAQVGACGPQGTCSEQTLQFDKALTGSQASLFAQSGTKALVHRAVEGFTATIFAYGQTGAGKTHSLLGPNEVMATFADDRPSGSEARTMPEPCLELVEAARRAKVSSQGLLPRSAQFLFKVLADAGFPLQGEHAAVVRTSFVEVYNERVFDLLNPSAGALDVRQRPSADQGFHVPGRTDVLCKSPGDLLKVLRQGVAARHTSGHSLSRESSRAHAIFTMELELGDGKSGRLVFSDLAGSERIKKIEGASVHETAAINKSLLMLSNCISALASDNSRSSPSFTSAFRNSKLTKMLMESLCGTGYTLLLAAISPAERHFDETANTLYFAAKCSNIRRTTSVNMSPHEREVSELKETIRSLRRELAEARTTLAALPPPMPAKGEGEDEHRGDGDDEDLDMEEEGIEEELEVTRAALELERQKNVSLAEENHSLKLEILALQSGRCLPGRPGPGSSTGEDACSLVGADLAAESSRLKAKQPAVEEEDIYADPQLPTAEQLVYFQTEAECCPARQEIHVNPAA